MFDNTPSSTSSTPPAEDGISRRLLDELTSLEGGIRSAQARQAEILVAYAERQRDLDAESAIVPSPRSGWSSNDAEATERLIAYEAGAALGISHTSARLLVSDCSHLVNHLPLVLSALRAGRLCLWAARQVSSATRVVAHEHAEALDGLLAEEAAQLLPGQVRGMVDARVAAIDSDAAAIRARLARDDARVYLVPQPDTVSTFGATLPAEQAAACYDALDSHARALRAAGDPRSLDHIRCDTLVERVTGAVSADQAYAVELQVVMTDRSLLGATSEPATLTGYGSMPLDLVRDLTASSRAWVRRLLTDPLDATVTAVDTKRRRFDSGLRRYLEIRDRRCRNPVCSAPLRDIDHRVEHADGGPTTAANGDGYCTRCHHLKHHPRIDVHAIDRSRPAGCDDPASNGHAVGWTGPSGRTRVSIAPPARGHGTATHDQVRHRARLLTGPIPDPRSAHRPETSADPPAPA